MVVDYKRRAIHRTAIFQLSCTFLANMGFNDLLHFDEDEYRRPSDEDERGYTGVDSDDRPVLSKVNSFVFSVSLLTVFYVETYGEGVVSYPQSPR